MEVVSIDSIEHHRFRWKDILDTLDKLKLDEALIVNEMPQSLRSTIFQKTLKSRLAGKALRFSIKKQSASTWAIFLREHK